MRKFLMVSGLAAWAVILGTAASVAYGLIKEDDELKAKLEGLCPCCKCKKNSDPDDIDEAEAEGMIQGADDLY